MPKACEVRVLGWSLACFAVAVLALAVQISASVLLLELYGRVAIPLLFFFGVAGYAVIKCCEKVLSAESLSCRGELELCGGDS